MDSPKRSSINSMRIMENAVFKTPKDDEFTVRVAHNVKEACSLVEAGFEYVTGDYNDGGKILRKRK